MKFIGKRSAFLITLIIITVITGIYFLGQGITGLIISQSCCFPPDCPAENLCDVVSPSFEVPANNSNGFLGNKFLLAGFGLLVAGLSVKIFHHKTN